MYKMLKFMLKFLCDEQGAVRRALLYVDRSCYNDNSTVDSRYLELEGTL